MTAPGKYAAVFLAIVIGFHAGGAGADNLTQHVLTDNDLLQMAGDTYASGELPLGDGHYVTDAPRKGYIYLCHPMGGEGGARMNGGWIHGSTWNLDAKLAVEGHVTWADAQFTDTVAGTMRILSGNGLPVDHPTGIFPIQPGDPAYAYDRNPNRIQPQTLHDELPLNPVYSDTPSCMGGEAGVMLTGVPLFNGFDAGMRDAAAHEIQDSCDGHPQRNGEYHYHSLSACIRDIGEKTVLGYALDGFPITGPLVAPGRYLTTADLDECHGITSEIIEDGHKKVTYHYVMTRDFPYSVSCFRAAPVRIGPGGKQDMTLRPAANPTRMGGGFDNPPQPPAEALAACRDKSEGLPCDFKTPRGDYITGNCRTPPLQATLACVPARMGF